MKNPKGYAILLVLAAVLGWLVWRTARATTVLRQEHEKLLSQQEERAGLLASKARLQASLPTETELAGLNVAASEASELRRRIEKLKTPQNAPPAKSQERWRNLGQGTPANTVHSIIWAATGGEVDALVPMLAYDDEGRAAIDEMFAALPPESRRLFPNAEKFIATMVACRVPTDLLKAQPIEQTDSGTLQSSASFELQRSAKSGEAPRTVNFRFIRSGDNWQLIVPKSVLLEFQQVLKPQ